ncbi:FHA domain-containing protein [Ectopseudomonas hydrolytica]|uniref:FHA domain-containing protein n=1 Tax=Ectopseudomonas hydrolytica TaxID=2493633 RepID=UPI000BC300BA|nr:FHA domain-containing protein [Pseudomonas hydrolytica]ATH81281.1 FHA domain-containing protein [Pseudomonas mendocina]MBF8163451.1 FHA domain-containing protein [Pseudomonas mendocina]UTH30432.1 FHA domain-containing protein [Pseudomonas hydrolytica]UZZ09573.1 FHA domain-containing protein [Pseudomonas mendocina]
MLRLQFLDNRQAPVWLTDERLTIGQDSRNQLVLGDAGIASFHAEIRQDHGYYYLSDTGQGATWVNDQRVGTRFQLRDGDRLRLGAVELLLVDPAKSAARPEAAAPRWFLQVIQGEHQGRKFHVHGSMTFGRSSKCELCFSDLELSRRHCEFFLKDDVLEVKDLASANGVMVNQQKVRTAVLQPGDQLKMGSVTLLVIGPKVSVSEAPDEDATQFMRVSDLPPALAAKAAGGGATQIAPVPQPARASAKAAPAAANPLRVAAQAKAAPVAAPPAASAGKLWLGGVVLLLIGVGLGAVAMRLLG